MLSLIKSEQERDKNKELRGIKYKRKDRKKSRKNGGKEK